MKRGESVPKTERSFNGNFPTEIAPESPKFLKKKMSQTRFSYLGLTANSFMAEKQKKNPDLGSEQQASDE